MTRKEFYVLVVIFGYIKNVQVTKAEYQNIGNNKEDALYC